MLLNRVLVAGGLVAVFLVFTLSMAYRASDAPSAADDSRHLTIAVRRPSI